MSARTLLLVDGEHYPPVIVDALDRIRASGHEPVAALFLGGTEKTAGPPDLGVPMLNGRDQLLAAIEDHAIEVVLDLSDEPVLDHRARFTLAAIAVTNGAAYVAGGMRLDPLPRPRLTDRPTLAVVGTGKRTGKTAVSIELVRHLRRHGARPVIVTMGRGGPPTPMILRAETLGDPADMLDLLTARGFHATSDYVEDAIFTGVDTIGTRRLGAGPTGNTVDDGFAAGVAEADRLEPDVIVYEGSGTAIPPAHADTTIVVTSSRIDPEYLVGYTGPVRLALADALVVAGTGSTELIDIVRRAHPHLAVFPGTFRPETSTSVADRSVVAVVTAPSAASEEIAGHLRAAGAASVEVVTSLSDRPRLALDLDRLRPSDLVLTEVKAAAAAIVLPKVRAIGAELGLIHNTVEIEPGWDELIDQVDPRPHAITSP